MKHYFICTKPLQYFNCINIASDIVGECYLYIIPNFSGAVSFVNRVKEYDKSWDKIEVINSKEQLNDARYIPKSSYIVFIDSDLQFSLRNGLCKNAYQVNVYEEGIGTYKKSITDVTSSTFKNNLIKLLSYLKIMNSRMGGNKKTNNIYLYNPDNYSYVHPDLKSKVKNFPKMFISNYLEYRSLFINVFGLKNKKIPCDKNILIFLTSNNRHRDFLNDFNYIKRSKSNYDCCIFKPHPYVQDLFEDNNNSFQGVMSEILLFELLAKNNQIDVYHYDSSTALYVKHQNAKFINLEIKHEKNKRYCFGE